MKIKIIFNITYLFIKDEIKNLKDKVYLNLFKNNTYKEFNHKKYDFFSKYQWNDKSKKKILITTFIGIYDYLKYEYLIAIYLSNIEKKNITVLLEEQDYEVKNFFLRKGINNFIYYKNKANFFQRVKYLIKAYNLINNISDIKDFVNFKYEGLPTGKMIYSHTSRFTRTPTFKKIEYRFYNILGNYLHFASEFKKILKKNSFEYFIQSETQFIPPAVCMGYFLKKKIRMISRMGNNQNISIRQINNTKHFLETRWKYDIQLFEKLKKEQRHKSIKAGKKIIDDRFNDLNKPDKEIDAEGIKLQKIHKIKFVENYNKKSICKKFNWEIEKPIGIIFANDLTDGLFTVKWGIYRDNYIWLEKILKFVSMNNDMNWLIKSHPSDFKNSGKLKTKYLFFKKKYPNNVQFFPENWGRKNLHKIINIVFTNYGTSGYEYAAKGIPSVISSEASYSGLKIAYETKTEKDLYEIILNSHKIKKLNKSYIENAQIFCYLGNVFTKVKLELATIDRSYEESNLKNYWKNFEKNFKRSNINKFNSLEKDKFYKSFKNQIDKKLKHLINLDIN